MRIQLTISDRRVPLVAGLLLLAFGAAELAPAQARRGFGRGDRKPSPEEAEQRRRAFEEAMKKIEAAEREQAAAKALEARRAAEAKRAQEELRRSVDEVAAGVAAGSNREADVQRAAVASFAAGAATKVPEDVRSNFEREPAAPQIVPPVGDPVKPAPTPPAVGDRPGVGDEPAPEPVAVGEGAKPETVIDADGQVIFDGSDRFGKDYQVVIFEENVRVTNPDFKMTSDRLTAYFKRPEKPAPTEGETPAPEGGDGEEGNQLERAVASGREVTVIKEVAGGEPQIAKARKATYFADREEVMLEIWPQVQRGQNLVIAKSKDTVIVLKGDEMIVKGPVRTQIVNRGGAKIGGGEGDGPKPAEGGAGAARTVIDAARGAVFNRPTSSGTRREMFFEGGVTVADPNFDIFCDELTAYMRETEEGQEMDKAVAIGDRVEVQRRTAAGEVQVGKANRVTHFTGSGDVLLEVWPEIQRASHSSVARERDALIVLKSDGDVSTRGRFKQLINEDGSRTPPPGFGGS